jgi:hypothetical protein
MLTLTPRIRTPMWLARGGVGLALLILLLILGFPGIAEVKSVTVGDVTTYAAPPFASVIFGVVGLITFVLAMAYWMQGGWSCRGVSIVLAAISLYVFFNAPTGLNHRLVVTPDYFFQRIGAWYAPVETRVDFNSLVYLTIAETKPDQGRKNYELRANKKETGEPLRIPMSDMLKKAMPEILKRAAERDVPIGDGAEAMTSRVSDV